MAVAALGALLEPMRTVCCVYTKTFRDQHETDEVQGAEHLDESVHLLLCNPPYNVRRQQNHQNSDHIEFNAKDMDVFYDFAEYVLNCGGRGYICSSGV